MQIQYKVDGNAVMAHLEDFRNIQESPCGFGDSVKEAFLSLLPQIPKDVLWEAKEWEAEWQEEANQPYLAEAYRSLAADLLDDLQKLEEECDATMLDHFHTETCRLRRTYDEQLEQI